MPLEMIAEEYFGRHRAPCDDDAHEWKTIADLDFASYYECSECGAKTSVGG